MTTEAYKPTVVPPTLKPAIPPYVDFYLTITFITLYGLLFCYVYVQIWLIIYLKHRATSYQSMFLLLCMFWSALRVTLFSFFFRNQVLANQLPTFFYWLLYCCPVCLQFLTLCLLLHFLFGNLLRVMGPEFCERYKVIFTVGMICAILAFMVSNITAAIITMDHARRSESVPYIVVLVRVMINDSLFILAGIATAISLCFLSRLNSTRLVFETQGMTNCTAVVSCVLIILLYLSRGVYNFIAISVTNKGFPMSFGYDWINISDQADNEAVSEGKAYISFGLVIFLWELVPTFIVVIIARVQYPHQYRDVPDTARNLSSSFLFDDATCMESEDNVSITNPHFLPFQSSHDGASWSSVDAVAEVSYQGT